jgi:hypothetical protein
MYVFIAIGIAIVAGSVYYVLKGVLAPHTAPAATTPAK